jgi:hypothetical protein
MLGIALNYSNSVHYKVLKMYPNRYFWYASMYTRCQPYVPRYRMKG